MSRERFTSWPASNDAERCRLRAIDGTTVRRSVAIVAADGTERLAGATLSIKTAEPFDGKADVAVRLAFEKNGPGAGERLVDDAWDLLDQFLREAAAADLPGGAAGR